MSDTRYFTDRCGRSIETRRDTFVPCALKNGHEGACEAVKVGPQTASDTKIESSNHRVALLESELSVLRGQLAAAETERDDNSHRALMNSWAALDATTRAEAAESALAAATTERDEETVGLTALGSVYRATLDELAATRTALLNVLEWPLPKGTVETWALPEWLAREARAALDAEARLRSGRESHDAPNERAHLPADGWPLAPVEEIIPPNPARRIWYCKIGEGAPLVHAADVPMRDALARAYEAITGHEPDFIFSGWGAELTEPERAVVENRLPAEGESHDATLKQLRDALVEARDVFVQIAAEPFDHPRYWLVPMARRGELRINAALSGSLLSVEWVDDSDTPGWFVCDKDGPIEGSYETRQEAEAALAVPVAPSEDEPGEETT